MKDARIVSRPQTDIRMIDVTIRAYSPAEETRTLFCGKLPADCFAEIEMKRLKKDALQVLEAISTFKTNVFQISGQRLWYLLTILNTSNSILTASIKKGYLIIPTISEKDVSIIFMQKKIWKQAILKK